MESGLLFQTLKQAHIMRGTTLIISASCSIAQLFFRFKNLHEKFVSSKASSLFKSKEGLFSSHSFVLLCESSQRNSCVLLYMCFVCLQETFGLLNTATILIAWSKHAIYRLSQVKNEYLSNVRLIFSREIWGQNRMECEIIASKCNRKNPTCCNSQRALDIVCLSTVAGFNS